MTRSARYVITELSASSVYSVAIRTHNGFGFSDWTAEYYFETAPGELIGVGDGGGVQGGPVTCPQNSGKKFSGNF